MYKPYPGYAMLHGLYYKLDDQHDVMIAAVKNLHNNDKKLHIFRDPQIQFWVTKKPLRDQNVRLEREKMENVDAYVCQYKNMWETIGRALGDKFPSNNARYKYAESPYLYGVDVTPLTRLKMEYVEATESQFPPLDIGMLDIETSVLPEYGPQILCASYTDWRTRQTFEFINSTWCHEPESKYAARMEKELKPFVEGLNDKASAVWSKTPHTFRYIQCEDERDLIIQLIGTAIYYKPDLCGVWNIGFDIPYIIQRAEFLRIDLVNLFNHPDVPEDLRYFRWKQDTSEVEHFTDVWHQVVAPGYTRWYDPMCLYSRIRKVKGRENYYSLDYIGMKIVGSGKMKFGQNNDHQGMQMNDKIGYCIYNCFDTVLPCIIDQVTDDTTSMMLLVAGDLADFSKQTAMLRSAWYQHCLTVINSVPGSVPQGTSMERPTDRYIWNKGGAVLNPNLLVKKGSPHLIETESPTALNLLVNDIDATLDIGVFPWATMDCSFLNCWDENPNACQATA